MSQAVAVTDESFSREVEQHPGLTVVDFWASWCGPCRALAPVIGRLAERYEGRVKVAKLDVDANAGTAMLFNVQSIPSVLFFRDGVLVDRTVGALPETTLAMKIEQLLDPREPLLRAG